MKFFPLVLLALFAGCATVKTPSPVPASPPQASKLVLSWAPGIPTGRLGGWTEVNGYRIFVAVDTGSPLSFYYDTSASKGLLKTLATTGSLTLPVVSDRLKLVDLTLGSWKIPQLEVVDLSGSRDFSDGGNAPAEGLVLGTQALANAWLIWDSSTRTLVLQPDALSVPSDFSPVPCLVTHPDGRLFLESTRNGLPFWFFIDTGTAASFPYVHEAEKSQNRGLKGWARGRPWYSTIYRSPAFSFAGQNVVGLPVYVDTAQPIDQAQVGLAFVKNFDWIFHDSRNGQFWTKLPEGYFDQASRSFGFSLSVRKVGTDYQIYVNAQLDEAPGAGELPPLGARVLSVNGKTVTATDFPSVEKALLQKTLTLTWEVDGIQKTASFTKTQIFG
jgi:hypothetical protein